jgi:hypothetical protein
VRREEQTRDTTARTIVRQDPDVRREEKTRDTTARTIVRQDDDVRVPERICDSMRRSLSRSLQQIEAERIRDELVRLTCETEERERVERETRLREVVVSRHLNRLINILRQIKLLL